MNKIQLNLIFGLSALATVAHRQCYELDGSLSVNWTSCGDDASYCCRSDYSKCYTEGVCKDVSNSPDPLQYLFWTSRCATSTWTVDCPIYCPSEGPDGNQSGYLWAWNDALTEFCCYEEGTNITADGRTCCDDDDSEKFIIRDTPVPLNETQSSTRSTSTVSELTIDSSFLPITKLTATSAPSISFSVSSASATQSSTTSVMASAAPATPTQSTTSTGISTGAKAGIGVGVAVGAIGVIAGLTLLLMRRKRKPTGAPTYEIAVDGQSQQMASTSVTPKRS